MAEWDLTPVLAKYLDHHFVYGLLEFIGSKKVYHQIVGPYVSIDTIVFVDLRSRGDFQL